jgi:hypothetical protein
MCPILAAMRQWPLANLSRRRTCYSIPGGATRNDAVSAFLHTLPRYRLVGVVRNRLQRNARLNAGENASTFQDARDCP